MLPIRTNGYIGTVQRIGLGGEADDAVVRLGFGPDGVGVLVAGGGCDGVRDHLNAPVVRGGTGAIDPEGPLATAYVGLVGGLHEVFPAVKLVPVGKVVALAFLEAGVLDEVYVLGQQQPPRKEQTQQGQEEMGVKSLHRSSFWVDYAKMDS